MHPGVAEASRGPMRAELARLHGVGWDVRFPPGAGASLALSADIHLNALNNSHDRVYL